MPFHIAFVGVSGDGHMNPPLAVTEELVRRGHRVSWAVTEEFAGRVRAVGAEPVSYAFTLPEYPDDDVPSVAPAEFLMEARATLPVIEEAWGGDRPDAVAYDGLAWAGRVLAAKWRLPGVEMWPSFVSNEHFSLEAEFLAGHPVDAELLAFARGMASFLAEHGLARTPVSRFLAHTERVRLAFFPRAFQFRGETFDDSFAFVGPCLSTRDRTRQRQWRPPADGRPVLLISLGTSYNDRPDFFRTCGEAFRDLPWHVVLSYGSRIDPAGLGELPANVEAHPYVPYLDVLPHAAAFVTHAGMGSAMEALTHATPMVAVPQMHEQEAVAARIADLGLGARLDPGALDAATLRETVLKVAGDPGVRDALTRMRDVTRAAGGAAAAADRIEADLALRAAAPRAAG
ncbi:macrolide family glycosyltransferase [Streptomyces sp. XH2]|uniref:macrolide family glycosyltransferase n=1 Tax=Streptomyces sp. XH2 TaxID=3412483 RepID=UPI003C7B7BDB